MYLDVWPTTLNIKWNNSNVLHETIIHKRELSYLVSSEHSIAANG